MEARVRKAGSATYLGKPQAPPPRDWDVTVRYVCGDRDCDARERILAPDDGKISVASVEIRVTFE